MAATASSSRQNGQARQRRAEIAPEVNPAVQKSSATANGGRQCHICPQQLPDNRELTKHCLRQHPLKFITQMRQLEIAKGINRVWDGESWEAPNVEIAVEDTPPRATQPINNNNNNLPSIEMKPIKFVKQERETPTKTHQAHHHLNRIQDTSNANRNSDAASTIANDDYHRHNNNRPSTSCNRSQSYRSGNGGGNRNKKRRSGSNNRLAIDSNTKRRVEDYNNNRF